MNRKSSVIRLRFVAALLAGSLALPSLALAQSGTDAAEPVTPPAADHAGESAVQAAEAAEAAEQAATTAEEAADAAAAADEAAAAAAASAAAATAAAAAAEEAVPETYYRGSWVGLLAISGSLNLNTTSQMPGQPNGLSLTFNTAVEGVLDYYKGKHEWRNTLGWNVGVTRSAADRLWVKSVDRLSLQSGYYFRVNDWFGPFAEFQFRTSVFGLYIQRPGEVPFCLSSGNSLGGCADGTDTAIMRTDSFHATRGFQPLTFDERIGVFMRPVDRTYFNLSTRVGLGAQQFVIGDDSYAEVDRNDDAILVRELESFNILGLLADLRLRGSSKSESFVYGADAGILYPFVDSTRQDLKDRDISPLQVDLSAFMTFTLSSWASLDLRGSAYRQPQVTGREWQRSFNVLLTFSHILVGDRNASRESGTTLRYEEFVGADGAAP